MKGFFKENAGAIAFTALAPALFMGVFALYQLPLEPVVYALVLYGIGWCLLWGAKLTVALKAHRERLTLGRSLVNGTAEFPELRTMADADYMDILRGLTARIQQMTGDAIRERQDAQDYYTLWVHQIKTPIAGMRMQLQAREEIDRFRLENELMRIEQYAEMALNYIRLENSPSDLQFREQKLDDVIRGCIRKYAPLFIAKKLRVSYEGTDVSVLTDAKWLSFIVEQLLSNAVKYTHSGSVAVTVTAEKELRISDTGIGILPDDLPRIFEKGFTGQNGRVDRRATGLGLYLCSLAAKRLGIGLRAESTVGVGTTFILDLTEEKISVD